MTKRTKSDDLFPSCKSRKIEADFQGGAISSNAGLLLVRQMDRKLGLIRRVAQALPDKRRQKSCAHSQRDLIKQRVFGIAAGYEDLNDHDHLRNDILMQTVVDRDQALGSSPTLCRLENSQDRKAAVSIHEKIVDVFIESFKKAPGELILDFDATDDPIHGNQEGKFFHGYYDHYCFLPLYVFCGEQLLVSYLRPSNIDPARHAWAILALLAKRLRQAWPDVRIIFRGDGGFCRWRMMRWMEHHNLEYIIGLPKNDRINACAEYLMDKAEIKYMTTEKKQRYYGSVQYGALSWDRERRVLVRAEFGPMGANPRYVVTNMKGGPKKLYEGTFCKRGDMENRIKEQQLHLFSDRTSCRKWWANQFRLLLSSLAYILLERMRATVLNGTKLARAQSQTIRLKLIKIGAVITRNTRRIRIHLSSSYPDAELFWLIAQRLTPH